MTFAYAPAPESRSVVDIAPSYGLFINGEFTDPIGGATFTTVNPATEEVLSEVSEAGADDVDRAVRAARDAPRAPRQDHSLTAPRPRRILTQGCEGDRASGTNQP